MPSNRLTWAAAAGALLGCAMHASGDLVLDEGWTPILHIDWLVSDLGSGTIEAVAEFQGDDTWFVTGHVKDVARVMAWSIIIDTGHGLPMINVQSLIAKNYSFDETTFSLAVDLQLAPEIEPTDRLAGELQLILAGIDGTVSTPKSAEYLWSLRADSTVQGGVFAPPWSMHVDSGGVSVFGGIDLELAQAPETSFGFGWDLTLTSGEAASVHGAVMVPTPAVAGAFVLAGLWTPRRRRPEHR